MSDIWRPYVDEIVQFLPWPIEQRVSRRHGVKDFHPVILVKQCAPHFGGQLFPNPLSPMLTRFQALDDPATRGSSAEGGARSSKEVVRRRRVAAP